jgi:hypothetical protein
MSDESQILLYRAEDGKTQIQVKLQDETVWLTQAQMAELFHSNIPNSSIDIATQIAAGVENRARESYQDRIPAVLNRVSIWANTSSIATRGFSCTVPPSCR